jgi:hypothetical protein
VGWDARGLETLKRGRFTVSDILLEKEEGRLSAKAMEFVLASQRTLPSTSLMSCQQVLCKYQAKQHKENLQPYKAVTKPAFHSFF